MEKKTRRPATPPQALIDWCLNEARRDLALGKDYIRVNSLLERAAESGEDWADYNKSWSPQVADALRAADPRLKKAIRVKARGTRGPNKSKPEYGESRIQKPCGCMVVQTTDTDRVVTSTVACKHHVDDQVSHRGRAILDKLDEDLAEVLRTYGDSIVSIQVVHDDGSIATLDIPATAKWLRGGMA